MAAPPSARAPEGGPPGRQALEQAAQWFVLLASGEASDDDRRRWRAWRGAHPAHEQAWQRAEGSTARFAEIAPDQAPASARALERAPRLASPGRRKGLAQLAVLLGGGLAAWQGYRGSDWSADARTAVGEQRDTALLDGSRLVLDTDTAVDIEFSATSRLIRLRRGRIMIATAPDPALPRRPFMVETADGRVLALGTRFSVRQEPHSTGVAVLEARVALHGRDGVGDAPILEAGQSARFNRAGLIEQQAFHAADAAWARGMLIANDMRLADLAAQLARYRSEPLTCDPAVAELRISGAFPLRDTGRALAAVGATLAVRFERGVDAGGGAGLFIRPK